MNYKQAVSFLESLPIPEKWGLWNMRALMKAMRFKQNFRVVHVTGTNGKGSACAMLYSMLRASGNSTGVYTSPHLVGYPERMEVNGRQITKPKFARLVEKVRQTMDENHLKASQFEVITAAAFQYFSKQRLDYLVLEVGLGGRLDATNTVNSDLAIITNIDLEHTRELGGTIAKIASEKAGIVKKNSIVVTGCTQEEALRPIRSKCKSTRSSLFLVGRDFSAYPVSFSLTKTVFDYQGKHSYKKLETPLAGLHQLQNAAISIAAAEQLKIPEKAIRAGLRAANWQGRLETLQKKPLVLLDGAHNPHGMRALCNSLLALKPKESRLLIVIGIMADKEYGQMLAEAANVADELILTRAKVDRSATPEQLAKELGKQMSRLHISKKYFLSQSVPSAISLALKKASQSDCICIAGSLVVVGEAKTYFFKLGKR